MFSVLILIVVLVCINGFFAASEMALVSISPSDLHRIKSEGKKNAVLLEKVTSDSTQYLSTIQVAITFAGFLSSAFAGSTLSGYVGTALSDIGISIPTNVLVILITFVLSFFTLVFGELVPKRIAMIKSESFALLCAPIINTSMIVFKPFVALLTLSTRGVLKLLRVKGANTKEAITEKDIKEMIVYGQIKGLYRSEEKDMMNRIFRYDDLTVGLIMTPIRDVIGLDINDFDKNPIQVIVDSKYSRVPIFDNQNVVGVILIKDLLAALTTRQKSEVDLHKLIKEPFLVNENTLINQVLNKMKHSKKHLAFVINDGKEIEGIVTMEDIVEEIVGNIYDEHDNILDFEKRHQEFSYVLDGTMTMREVNEVLEINIACSNVDMTISDFVRLDLEYTDIQLKEIIPFSKGEIEVLSLDEYGIEQLRIILNEFTK